MKTYRSSVKAYRNVKAYRSSKKQCKLSYKRFESCFCVMTPQYEQITFQQLRTIARFPIGVFLVTLASPGVPHILDFAQEHSNFKNLFQPLFTLTALKEHQRNPFMVTEPPLSSILFPILSHKTFKFFLQNPVYWALVISLLPFFQHFKG